MKSLLLILFSITNLVSSEVTFAGYANAPYINKIVKPEFVGYSIAFSSEIGKEEKKNKAIETATSLFWSAVAADISIIKFSGSPEVVRDYGNLGSSSFSISSYTAKEDQVREITYILKKINENETAMSSAVTLSTICKSIKLNDDVKVNLYGFYQGVFDANKFRDELVHGIITDVKKYADTSSLSGLENNVSLSGYQNGLLRAFIPYKFTANITK
jgi:hypothetical protein